MDEGRHWACVCVGEYSGCSRDSGAVTLYKVDKAPVSKSWFERYNRSTVVFYGSVLQFTGSDANRGIAQAKRPISPENCYFEVQVCVYVCVCVYT
jgi:hypothetical protein